MRVESPSLICGMNYTGLILGRSRIPKNSVGTRQPISIAQGLAIEQPTALEELVGASFIPGRPRCLLSASSFWITRRGLLPWTALLQDKFHQSWRIRAWQLSLPNSPPWRAWSKNKPFNRKPFLFERFSYFIILMIKIKMINLCHPNLTYLSPHKVN